MNKIYNLSLETSTNLCSISIKNNNYYIETKNKNKKNNNENILINIDYITYISNIKLYNINTISYNFGPGSFTGLRLSSIICQSISIYIKNIIRISSLHNIAQATCLKYKYKYMFISMTSKYNEIYLGIYKYNNNKKLIFPIMPEKIKKILCIKSLPTNIIYTGSTFSIKNNIKNKKNILKSIYNRYPTVKQTSILSEKYLMNQIKTSINNVNPNYIIENIF